MVKRVACDPYLDRGLRGWITKTAQKNYWRVAAWMGLDDLVQDGFLCYMICRRRYTVANKRHMMALVKITYINHITDLANARTRLNEVAVSQIAAPGHEPEALEHLGGCEEGDAELGAALAHAPDEVRQLIALLNDPNALEKLRRPARMYADGTRETHGERLCRLLGIPKDFNLEAQLRAALG